MPDDRGWTARVFEAPVIDSGIAVAPRARPTGVRIFGFTLLFFAFLYPISFDGLSVNYGFALMPLLAMLLFRRIHHPGGPMILAMTVYCAIFFLALIYQFDLVDKTDRRLASFALFITMFAFTFIDVDESMSEAFKNALLLISLYFSIVSVYLLFTLGGASLGFEAKDVVGSQRYGFIYLLAIWIMLLDRNRRRALGLLWYPVLLGLLAGLLLTFSRSSIVALLGSGGLYFMFTKEKWRSLLSPRALLKGFALLIVAAITVGALYAVFPVVFDFFGVRLFEFFANTDEVKANVGDQNTSEGTRIYIAMRILDYVARNPITGSGFLGVWALPDSDVGSAHNQLLDVLLRTGIPGFFVYCGLIFCLLRYLWGRERPLFWGTVGVLVYGLFHETFKESQGGCVLAVLFGMLATSWRKRRVHDAMRLRSEPLTTRTSNEMQ